MPDPHVHDAGVQDPRVHEPRTGPRWVSRPGAVTWVFVLLVFAPGFVFGFNRGLPSCTITTVEVLHVVPQNLGLAVLLASGYFCLGMSTGVVGLFTLSATGASVGSIVAGLGWPGVALLLPHGIFEFAAALLATDIGLRPLTARARRGSPPSGRDAARDLLVVVALVVVAGVVETAWTSFYGPNSGCDGLVGV